MKKPTTTQIGAIAENLVANALMIESGGRLSPFNPVADDDGLDILIYDKRTGRAIPAQIKSRTNTLKKRGGEARGNIVHFEIRRATLKDDDYTYLIGVLLRADLAGIECSWIIPMKEVLRLGTVQPTKVVLRASKAKGSKDKYSMFRCDVAGDLAKQAEKIFDRMKSED
jgi:hypothetical protein